MNVTADILELDVEVKHFIVEVAVCTLNLAKVMLFGGVGIKPNRYLSPLILMGI